MKIKASCRQDEKATRIMTYMGLYGTKKPIQRLILRTVLFVALLLLLLLEISLLGWNGWVITLLVVLILACCMEYWRYFVTPKLRYQALKSRQKQRSFVFRQDAVCVDDRLTLPYESLYRVAETKDYIVLFQSRKKLLMVAKATITGGTPEQLCSLLQEILDERYITCNY